MVGAGGVIGGVEGAGVRKGIERGGYAVGVAGVGVAAVQVPGEGLGAVDAVEDQGAAIGDGLGVGVVVEPDIYIGTAGPGNGEGVDGGAQAVLVDDAEGRRPGAGLAPGPVAQFHVQVVTLGVVGSQQGDAVVGHVVADEADAGVAGADGERVADVGGGVL